MDGTSTVVAAVLDSHRQTVEAVVAAGRDVAAGWPGRTASDRAAIVGPLESRLDDRNLTDKLVPILRTAVDATGLKIAGTPVPAPPYVVVTSRGPLCRGTVAGGSRLVVRVELFAVERDPPRYRFLDPSPERALRTRVRPPTDEG